MNPNGLDIINYEDKRQSVTCPECNRSVKVPDLNVGVINDPDISLVHCVHVEGVDCLCGAYLKPVIVAIPNGTFAWVPIERPKDKRIEVPRITLAH